MEQQIEFKEWCVVELFGHQRIAGVVSSQEIGGESFIRVDVPEISDTKAFTKFFGKGAIYSMTPVSEELAKAYLKRCHNPPIERYYLEDHSPSEPEDD